MAVSINVPLSNVLQTVERPVVYDVIRRLQDLTQISSKTPIRFYGADARGMQYNSSITKDKESDNLWPHIANLTIEVEEDHDPDHLLSTPVKQQNAPPVFEDRELGISIKPVYSVSIVKIRFLYKAADKNEAEKWRNEIRTRFSAGRDIFMHDVQYSWHVPEVYVAILQELYRLRQNVAGYEDTFPQYLTSGFTSKATFTTNLSATQSALVISEPQCRIQGQFDFEGMPEKAAKEDEPNLWATSFTYQFRYDKPVNSVMVYPVSVHQQMVPAKYRYNNAEYSYQALCKQYAASLNGLAKFESDTMDLRYRSNQGLDIPWFDHFTPSSIPAGTVKVVNVLTSVTEQDRKSLFKLDDLGEFNIRSEIVEFIRSSEYSFITKPGASVIQLHYYQDHFIREQANLTVGPDLMVSAVDDFDLRKQHRVRISLVANFSMLNKAALTRLRANPLVAAIIVTAINQATKLSGNRKDFLGARLPVNVIRGLGLDYAPNGMVIPYAGWVRNGPQAGVTSGGYYDVYGNFGFNYGLVQTLFISTAHK